MKSLTTSLLFILLTIVCYGQTELTYNSGNPQFQKVLDVPEKNAPDLYKMVNRWVALTFNNPDAATYSKVENEMVRGEGFRDAGVKLAALAYGDMRYRWQIDIKDTRVRFTLQDMKVITTSGTFGFEMYVFKKDGSERTNYQAKNVKESYAQTANDLFLSLQENLTNSGKQKGDDW